MGRKNFVVLFTLITILMCSCSQENSDILYSDNSSSYNVIDFGGPSVFYMYDFNFESIDEYITKKAPMAAVIRVYVYDESTEIPIDTSKRWDLLPYYTISKVKVLEVYFKSDDLEYDLKTDDYIWISQSYYIDEESKTISYQWNTALMVPGCEYLIYTLLYHSYGNEGIYQGYGIFICNQAWAVPLDISGEEYKNILEKNNFEYFDYTDIYTKAIDKYINGNK